MREGELDGGAVRVRALLEKAAPKP
jgi:hypothetical protein